MGGSKSRGAYEAILQLCGDPNGQFCPEMADSPSWKGEYLEQWEYEYAIEVYDLASVDISKILGENINDVILKSLKMDILISAYLISLDIKNFSSIQVPCFHAKAIRNALSSLSMHQVECLYGILFQTKDNIKKLFIKNSIKNGVKNINHQERNNLTKKAGLLKMAINDGGRNSIFNVFSVFFYRYSFFRSVWFSYRLAEVDSNGSKVFNKYLFDYTNSTFGESFHVFIRKVVDGGALNGPRGVYSLRNIFDSIKKGLNKFVLLENMSESNLGFENFNDYCDFISKRFSVDEDGFMEIFPEYLESINKKFEELLQIAEVATKFTVHNASDESKRLEWKDGITFEELAKKEFKFDEVIKIATYIYTEISKIVLFTTPGFVGFYDNKLFYNFDVPMMNEENKKKLQSFWKEYFNDFNPGVYLS